MRDIGSMKLARDHERVKTLPPPPSMIFSTPFMDQVSGSNDIGIFDYTLSSLDIAAEFH